MGAKTITRDKNFLVITNSGVAEYFFKDGVDITIDSVEDIVLLSTVSSKPYRLDYTEVTSPTVASSQELADILAQYTNQEDIVTQFGNAPDFDTADGAVTIWDGAADGTAWENMVYNYSTTAAIDSISSSDDTDTEEITIIGLDSSWDEVEQTITLTGQTRKALDTNLIRVYSAYNANGTVLVGHVFIYENDTTSSGVPDDPELIRAIIQPNKGQTLMAVYTVPDGKQAYIKSWYASTAGANKSSNYVIELKTRETGKVFRTQHLGAISDLGTSSDQHPYPSRSKGPYPARTDIEMTVEMTATGGTAASISGGFDVELVDV